jgi:CrcB protein
MNTVTTMVVLAAGGSAGSILRGWLGERFATMLPWTTLFINVTGSFASGWLNGHFSGEPDKAWVLTLAVTGVCGGYTTFSTLAFQLLVMWRERRSGRLAIYLTLTLGLGLLAAWAGLVAGARH